MLTRKQKVALDPSSTDLGVFMLIVFANLHRPSPMKVHFESFNRHPDNQGNRGDPTVPLQSER